MSLLCLGPPRWVWDGGEGRSGGPWGVGRMPTGRQGWWNGGWPAPGKQADAEPRRPGALVLRHVLDTVPVRASFYLCVWGPKGRCRRVLHRQRTGFASVGPIAKHESWKTEDCRTQASTRVGALTTSLGNTHRKGGGTG